MTRVKNLCFPFHGNAENDIGAIQTRDYCRYLPDIKEKETNEMIAKYEGDHGSVIEREVKEAER